MSRTRHFVADSGYFQTIPRAHPEDIPNISKEVDMAVQLQ